MTKFKMGKRKLQINIPKTADEIERSLLALEINCHSDKERVRKNSKRKAAGTKTKYEGDKFFSYLQKAQRISKAADLYLR